MKTLQNAVPPPPQAMTRLDQACTAHYERARIVSMQLTTHENIQYATFPAIKIGLLAADSRAKGAGSCLIDWAIEFIATEVAPKIGVRFVTVDALYDPDDGYDVSEYYKRWGFEFAYPDEPLPPSDGFRTLYLDLLPFIEALSNRSLATLFQE